MIKKNISNKTSILMAMTIGISAAMAAMTPVNAFADDEVNPVPGATDPVQDTSENTAEATAAEEAVQAAEDTSASVAVAEAAVEVATDAIASGNEAAPVTEAETVAVEAASTEDGGAVAAIEIKDLLDAANDAGIAASFDDVKDGLGKAAQDLEAVVEADEDITAAADEAAKDATSAEHLADLASAAVDNANTQVDTLSQAITDASSAEEAQQNYDAIATLVQNTKEDVAIKQAAVEELAGKYDKAKTELRDAQERFKQSLGKANSEVADAKAALDKAEGKVNSLETELNEAKAALEEEQQGAEDINAKQAAVSAKKNDWAVTRNLLQSFVENYYIPQLVDAGATDITWVNLAKDKTRIVKSGFDTQDCNYAEVTYIDSEGQPQTKYFNYDRKNC